MGSSSAPGGFKGTDVLICTIEKANNMINRFVEFPLSPFFFHKSNHGPPYSSFNVDLPKTPDGGYENCANSTAKASNFGPHGNFGPLFQ
jgi:hypothetical protein